MAKTIQQLPPERRLEALTQQFVLNHSAAYLFQLATAVAQGLPQCSVESRL